MMMIMMMMLARVEEAGLASLYAALCRRCEGGSWNRGSCRNSKPLLFPCLCFFIKKKTLGLNTVAAAKPPLQLPPPCHPHPCISLHAYWWRRGGMNLKGASLAAPKDSYISHRAWKAIVKTARPPLSLTTDTHTYSLTPPIPTTPHPQTWKKKTVRHHKRIPVNTESADHWTSRLWDGSGLAFFFFKNNKWLKCKWRKFFHIV